MVELETLKQILDSSIKIDKICLSYVARIFPEFKNTLCYILYKEVCKSPNNSVKYTNDDETSLFDITGSPLKCSFKENDFEDTIFRARQNWFKEEENYLPLSRTEACNALNACIEFTDNSFPPIFALCDGKDNKKSRLLGAIIEGKWFTTIEVYSAGSETLETIKKSSSEICQQHLELSHAREEDLTISAFNIFDLFETREETLNLDDNMKSNFEGSLSIEVATSSLSVHLPTRATKNNLFAQVITNSNNSPLKELWKQLLLLNQYLNIIDNYKKNTKSRHSLIPLRFPHDFTSPYEEKHDVILKNLSLLLNEDYSFRNSRANRADQINLSNIDNLGDNIKIRQYAQNLPDRNNLDFTDFLWDLLIMNSDYFEMVECINIVLEEIIINGCLSQVKFMNSTRFSNIITHSHQQKVVTHLLSSSLPLEYVIDMGFEKLCKDYTYILNNARFGELYDIKKELKSLSYDEFIVDTYRKKLIYLVQIHVCLEFMLLLEDNLECSTDDLKRLFCCAYEQYVGEKSPLKNVCDLAKHKIYTLSAPLPVSAINLIKEVLSTRRISLSSQSKLSKLTTIKYYSQLPIFPTNIYTSDESTYEEYYVISAICSSSKFR
ncbi:protein zwilch homolog [Xylocopa sonorina]|uniref:protein zwilch homolog n=1 Tax=Xylocopa sonorina TaxID=1818115 RepID=UPI00403AB310